MANADRLILQPDDMDFAAYMSMTDAAHKVRAVNDYRKDLGDEVQGISEWGRQSFLPWPKMRDKFAYRPGEVTVYVGINGHGKSLVMGQIAMSQMAQGEVVLIFSFEMKPRRTLARMLQQWGGDKLAALGLGDVDAFVDWCENKLWLYDQQGMVDAHKLIGVAQWAIDNLGVTHIVWDNLAKVVKGEDSYDAQKEFVDRLTVISRDKNVHNHLLHHPKKLLDESQPPRKFDLKGSGAITDQPDNVISIWKNKPKIEALQRGDMSKAQEPDGLMIIDKQRNGESWEGKLALAFHYASQQLIEPHEYAPLDFRTPFPHKPLIRTRAVPQPHGETW
jgi:twinkle protein